MGAGPSFVVRSRDGTGIAVFESGEGPPIVLVHGTAADHTTFRVVGPLLAADHAVFAIDRRGRGASGDGPDYAIEREFEDLAAVAEAVAARVGVPALEVVGHSFGGRVALGATRLTRAIRRLVIYEGAPAAPGAAYHDDGLAERLAALVAAGDNAAALEAFLRAIVGMGDAEIAAYRANPVWPARVAVAPTIVRELRAEVSASASLAALGSASVPVLQVLGGASLPAFGAATVALDARLADGRVVVIDGARHAAHHTHPDVFVEAVRAFLDDPTSAALSGRRRAGSERTQAR